MRLKKITMTMALMGLIAGLAACGPKEKAPVESSSQVAGESVEAGQAGMPTTPPAESGKSGADEEINKLSQEENEIFAKDKDLWDKVFLSANKDSGMITDGTNYGEFLKKTIESAKDKFTADELKILNEGADKIVEIEKKIEELKKQVPAQNEAQAKPQDGQSTAPAAAATGEKFPSFQGKDLDGNALDNSLFSKNAVTVINFWFSTCNPCIGELDELEALNKDLKAKGGEVIGVNSFTLDDQKEAIEEAKEILKKKGASYRNITFPSDSEAGKYVQNIMSFPTTIVVDRQGNMVGDPIMGAVAEGKQHEELMNRINQILEKDKK